MSCRDQCQQGRSACPTPEVCSQHPMSMGDTITFWLVISLYCAAAATVAGWLYGMWRALP